MNALWNGGYKSDLSMLHVSLDDCCICFWDAGHPNHTRICLRYSSYRCRPPQAVLTGDLTPPRSAAKQGRRQEPCTIKCISVCLTTISRPRLPAAVLLRLAIRG